MDNLGEPSPVCCHLDFLAQNSRGVGVDPDGADDGRHSHSTLEAPPDDNSGDKGWVSDGDLGSSLALLGWFLSVHVLLHVPISFDKINRFWSGVVSCHREGCYYSPT